MRTKINLHFSNFQEKCIIDKRNLYLFILPSVLLIFVILLPGQSAEAVTFHFDSKNPINGIILNDTISYTQSDIAIIRIDDSANPLFTTNNKTDTITVTISSKDPFGTPVDSTTAQLTETGPNTGIFKNPGLIFTPSHTLFSVNSVVTVSQMELNDMGFFSNCPGGGPISSLTVDTICVALTSTSSPGPSGIPSLILTETNASSGNFVANVRLSGVGSSIPNTIVVKPNDILSVDYLAEVQNALIAPIGNGLGEILVFPCDGVDIPCDTISVTYGALSSADQPIMPGGGGGGGGGGLIRPGLVLDFLFAIGGSPYVVSPPSFGGGSYPYSDGLTLTQGDTKSTFDTSLYNQEIPSQVMKAGIPVSMTFKTFESYNPTGIIHMGLYIIPRGEDMITVNSIGSIVWDKGQPIEISDPNHMLSDVNVSPTDDGKFQYTTFSFTPTKSYDKMSFLVRAWNDHLYSTDIRVHDDIVTAPPVKTLPPGVLQYNNFADLQSALEKDRFYKPQILSHIHGTSDVFPNNEGGTVYWLYDTMQHTVTLVIADKNDNILSSQNATLQPYAVEKKGDYGFMYFTVEQLNRWNEEQMKSAMYMEAAKSMAFASENGLVYHKNW